MSETTFRNWHNTLFLGPMPGTEAPLQEWLDKHDEVGSYPETDQQDAFLASSLP
jgi:hypothetical protein